jgi:asparagine synthase (glutamine-hydrolysing)
MCGIVGYYGRDGSCGQPVIEKMMDALERRGPDERGSFFDDNCGVGQTRLSIIDLKTGAPPVFNETKDVCVVCNGEIYNYRELRNRLIKDGHAFSTATDTEVLAHLYEEAGRSLLEQIDGMFAFIIYDKRNRFFFCARDRVGKKPLYYSNVDGCIFLASEIKSLLTVPGISRDISIEALNHFLTLQYVPDSMSIFKNIKKVSPAEYLIIKEGMISERKNYWRLDPGEQMYPREEVQAHIRQMVEESVIKRMVSDVPLGVFLSGGFDSSVVAAMMAENSSRRINSFTIGFKEEKFNEVDVARTIADKYNTNHHEFIVDREAIKNDIVDIVSYFDEPFADPSALPMHYLCALTRQYVKVALSGDGGDELFAGYARYKLDTITRHLNIIPTGIFHLISTMASVLRVNMYTPIDRNITVGLKRLGQIMSIPESASIIRWGSYFSPADKEHLFNRDYLESLSPESSIVWLNSFYKKHSGEVENLNRKLYTDLMTYTPGDYCVKGDRMSMKNSLELRCPFLDQHLIRYIFGVASRLKMDKTPKQLLKDTFKDMVTDDVIRFPKKGFSIPLGLWMQQSWINIFLDYSSGSESMTKRYFEKRYINKLIREHCNNVNNHGKKLYALLCLEIWANNYVR